MVVVFIFGIYGGLIIGSTENQVVEGDYGNIPEQIDPTEPYEYVDCTTCWVELYDDGRAIIHTEQQWLTNDNAGNIVILTETMEPIE